MSSIIPGLSEGQLRVRRRLIDDIAALPTLPTVVSKLASLSPNAEDYFEKVANLVAQDPALATRLLIVANSGAKRGAAAIKTIQDAVVRLGARGVSNLVVTMGMAHAIPPRSEFERAFWVHALEVASGARALARGLKDKSVHPEEIYLAGLLHDLGRIVLFHEATDELKKPSEGEWESPEELLRAETELCGVDHTDLGARACRRWGIPEPLCLVVRHHHASEIHDELTEESFKLIEIVQSADSVLFQVEPPSGRGIHETSDDDLARLLANALPYWATVDPWSLLAPLREAVESAHQSARAMGVIS